jgi:hypothetical protein
MKTIQRKDRNTIHRQFSRREFSGGVMLNVVPTRSSRSSWKDFNPDFIF